MSENNSEDDGKVESTGHVYDGIEELDNRLPNWWLWTLFGSILFAIGYFGYYVMGEGPSLVKEYEHAKAEREYTAYQRGDTQKGPTQESLLAAYKNLERRKQGQATFSARCVACHGDHSQGGIGPNLTDEYWLHGGKLLEIAHTITNGVADKGMPPWGPILKQEEIESVVAYVRSIRGSNPAGAKAPQGEKATDLD